jgi:Flp pilus assembly protein TadD
LSKAPSNLHALVLAGAVLDFQRRYDEAERYYRRALRVWPNSAQVLNNMSNHFLARGNASPAREFYLKAIAADPKQPNANLQLARISVEEKQGRGGAWVSGSPATNRDR